MRLPKCGVGLGWLSPGCCANLHKLHGQYLHKCQPCPLSPNDAVNSLNPLLIFRTITMPNIQGPTEIDFSAISLNDDSTSTASTRSSSPVHSDISETEATFYYSGLPSSPKLVYRSGTTPWTKSTGLKELRPVFGHKLNAIWKDLDPKVCDYLDSVGVSWTTIDVVRFNIKVGEVEAVGPVVLWIGVLPETLFGENAHTAACGCLNLLKEFGITDVEVEFRESIYTRSANLYRHVSNSDPTVNVSGPLTPALGLSIAAKDTPHAEGTGGFYLAEGGDSQKILLVTARHVLFPPDTVIGSSNVDYTYTDTDTSAAPENVLLLGTKAFKNLEKSIEDSFDIRNTIIDNYKKNIEYLAKKRVMDGEDEDNMSEEAAEKLRKTQTSLGEANVAMVALREFEDEVKNGWSNASQRILGHTVRSPPLGVGTDGFTEDYAVVELDTSKFVEVFMGNVIDLGTTRMAPTTFEYPENRLLQLQDIIPEEHMCNPLHVIKNGFATGVTIGLSNGISSKVRHYFPNSASQTSREWAILPYGNEAFSAAGDSGSIIADDRGRMGGLLNGGSSGDLSPTLDITYATPLFWLLPRIKDKGFPNAHLQPVMAQVP